MKNYSNKILLIIGFLVASMAFNNTFSLADTESNNIVEAEQYRLAESILYELNNETNTGLSESIHYKIYSCDNKLVYEARKGKDQKLKILLLKSDLLTTIDNIFYYKLSR